MNLKTQILVTVSLGVFATILSLLDVPENYISIAVMLSGFSIIAGLTAGNSNNG